MRNRIRKDLTHELDVALDAANAAGDPDRPVLWIEEQAEILKLLDADLAERFLALHAPRQRVAKRVKPVETLAVESDTKQKPQTAAKSCGAVDWMA